MRDRINLRHRVILWVTENTVSGSGEKSQNLVEFGRFWCSIRVRAMSQISDGNIETTISRHDLTFRYSEKLFTLPQDAQIEINGVKLHITGINLGDYRKKYIHMTAAERR